MEEQKNKTLRLRFKLKTGEEFEAEGDIDFITLQKQEFLNITNSYKAKLNPIQQNTKQGDQDLQAGQDLSQAKQDFIQNNDAPILNPAEGVKEQRHFDEKFVPSYLKQPQTRASANLYGQSLTSQPHTQASLYNEQLGPKTLHNKPIAQSGGLIPKGLQKAVLLPNQEVWDKIALYNGSDIILREKNKNINTAAAALIILGAAKVLRDIPSMTALELAKCLKLSGYLKGGERLDRAIAAEVKEASLLFEGAKRNRSYIITQKGLAKAFTTAERALIL